VKRSAISYEKRHKRKFDGRKTHQSKLLMQQEQEMRLGRFLTTFFQKENLQRYVPMQEEI
jgi:hypothetical protein